VVPSIILRLGNISALTHYVRVTPVQARDQQPFGIEANLLAFDSQSNVLVRVNSLERVEQVNAGEASVQEFLRSAEIEDQKFGAGSLVLPTQPQLVIAGQEAVGLALVRLAKAMKFAVTVVDPLIAIDDVPGVDRVLHIMDFSQLPSLPLTPSAH
jgi:hypothetical protein